jgi:FkbH-like protein
MPLRREHLVAWRIDWQPKPVGLAALAEQLQLGLDSFIFVDDDPLVCAEVHACLPEVLTLQLPQDPERIPTFLSHIWDFDHLRSTAEDRQRTLLYQQNIQREHARHAAPTIAGFLESLRLEVEIAPLAPETLERAAQLTQRTNQFNLTTRRRSAGDLRALCLGGPSAGLTVAARDRFGDYGLVGLLIYAAVGDALVVDTLLLSCRALGRTIEQRVLVHAAGLAQARGLAYVELTYIPTAKNRPALDFLEQVGGPFRQPCGDTLVFRIPVETLLLDAPVALPPAPVAAQAVERG